MIYVILLWLFVLKVSLNNTHTYKRCCSVSGHPLTSLLHDYQNRACQCVCTARETLATIDSAIKLDSRQLSAEDSTCSMSSLPHGLPPSEISANLLPEAQSVGMTSDAGIAAENTTVCGNDGSSTSETDFVPSSVPSSDISSAQDEDQSGQQSLSGVECLASSRIARNMAAEVLLLLDQLESQMLSTYDELQNESVSDDARNTMQLVLQGIFFTHLWTDILTFYR